MNGWLRRISAILRDWQARSNVARRLATGWQTFRGPAWPVNVVMGVCLAVGAWLRVRGYLYDVPSLWVDEAAWAMLLFELPLRELLIRPPGFMLVTRALAEVFGPVESAYRFLPWLAAMGSLVIAPLLARRMFRAPAARLLFVAVIALHPAATDFAKEFKPYSVSLTLHLWIALLTLRYLDTRRSRDLAWLLGLSVLGIFFTQDLVFAYPAAFGLIGFAAFRHDRRHLVAIGLSALLVLSALGAQYVFIWSGLSAQEDQYWGNKYNVFYVASQKQSYWQWLSHAYLELVAFPGYESRYWNASLFAAHSSATLVALSAAVWLILHVAGLLVLAWRRDLVRLALAFSPILVCMIFNRMGYWPFGVFRTNVFLVAYFALVAAMALDGTMSRHPLGAVFPGLFLLVPLLLFEEGLPPTKRAMTRSSSMPEVIESFAERANQRTSRKRELVLLARGTCATWRYYLHYHPDFSHHRALLERAYETRCREGKKEPFDQMILDAAKSRRTPVWLVHGGKRPFHVPNELAIVDTQQFPKLTIEGYVIEQGDPRARRRSKMRRRAAEHSGQEDDDADLR